MGSHAEHTKISLKLEMLTGSENWFLWKHRMSMLLRSNGLWKTIEPGTHAADATSSQITDFQDKQNKALGDINLHVSDEIIPIIIDETTPREAWNKLLEHFECKKTQNIVYAKKHYQELRYADGEDMMQYINSHRQAASQLTALGKPVDAEEQAWQLLLSLPESWGYFVASITAGGSTLSGIGFEI